MIKIQIKGTDIELTQEIKDYIHEKLNALDKFISSEVEVVCDVEVGRTTEHHKKGDVFKAEVNLVSEGKQYYVVVTKDDIMAAIDKVKDEVVKKIRRSKKKRETLIKKGGKIIKSAIKGFKK